MNYYNDIDPYAAQWLRNLIADGHIPAGDVDDRDIQEVTPDDLKSYTQCHFFAGIGGWPYALRLAGWPEDQAVWTGSCPCQPLSSAGLRQGHADQRHLWPSFQSLIAQCRPSTVFGEQVASKDGCEWFAAVRADLEECGYACGCVDLAAASVGAPHIRQRLYWVADAERDAGVSRRVTDESREGARTEGARAPVESRRRRDACGLDDACEPRLERQSWNGDRGDQPGRLNQETTGPVTARVWTDLEFIDCADGKTRVTQPGLCPLAHGVPNRVGKLRAYGNAIVPQVAEVFIRTYMTDEGIRL